MRKGVPLEVLRELNIKIVKKDESKIPVTAIVEKHQVKLPVPGKIRRELEFSKGQKVNVSYNPKTKTLTYQL